ncbi:putative uncharacterized protein DDB_G0271606 [Hydractinia symbiolongicarpus]|uniref:putative uncharacterized protein DDB_G0271606 n=1 Tax=Hydractinia symbiolongicarpus TaxID=13093 RepID=UPI00254FC1B1|nr:putative uncharacterized protein DDB_G0271606 [Hydractinia symbiolongicarpus]
MDSDAEDYQNVAPVSPRIDALQRNSNKPPTFQKPNASNQSAPNVPQKGLPYSVPDKSGVTFQPNTRKKPNFLPVKPFQFFDVKALDPASKQKTGLRSETSQTERTKHGRKLSPVKPKPNTYNSPLSNVLSSEHLKKPSSPRPSSPHTVVVRPNIVSKSDRLNSQVEREDKTEISVLLAKTMFERKEQASTQHSRTPLKPVGKLNINPFEKNSINQSNSRRMLHNCGAIDERVTLPQKDNPTKNDGDYENDDLENSDDIYDKPDMEQPLSPSVFLERLGTLKQKANNKTNHADSLTMHNSSEDDLSLYNNFDDENSSLSDLPPPPDHLFDESPSNDYNVMIDEEEEEKEEEEEEMSDYAALENTEKSQFYQDIKKPDNDPWKSVNAIGKFWEQKQHHEKQHLEDQRRNQLEEQQNQQLKLEKKRQQEEQQRRQQQELQRRQQEKQQRRQQEELQRRQQEEQQRRQQEKLQRRQQEEQQRRQQENFQIRQQQEHQRRQEEEIQRRQEEEQQIWQQEELQRQQQEEHQRRQQEEQQIWQQEELQRQQQEEHQRRQRKILELQRQMEELQREESLQRMDGSDYFSSQSTDDPSQHNASNQHTSKNRTTLSLMSSKPALLPPRGSNNQNQLLRENNNKYAPIPQRNMKKKYSKLPSQNSALPARQKSPDSMNATKIKFSSDCSKYPHQNFDDTKDSLEQLFSKEVQHPVNKNRHSFQATDNENAYETSTKQNIHATIGWQQQQQEEDDKTYEVAPRLPQPSTTLQNEDRFALTQSSIQHSSSVPPRRSHVPLPPLPDEPKPRASSLPPESSSNSLSSIVPTKIKRLLSETIGSHFPRSSGKNSIISEEESSPYSFIDERSKNKKNYDQISSNAEQPLNSRLNNFPWYKGSISRQEAEQYLRQKGKEGSFIVKKSSKDDGYALYTYTGGEIKHLRINHSGEEYYIGTYSTQRFSCIEKLIKHYQSAQFHLSSGATVLLAS